MFVRYFFQVILQCPIKNHLSIRQWLIVDQPVKLCSGINGGVDAILDAGAIQADDATVCISQFNMAGVDVEGSG